MRMATRRTLVVLCVFALVTLSFRSRWDTALERRRRLSVYSHLKSTNGNEQEIDSNEEEMLYSNSDLFQKKQNQEFQQARVDLSVRLDSYLTAEENKSISQCVSAGIKPINKTANQLNVLRYGLNYLTNTSIVIDVGGNIGWSENIILKRFNLKKFIILEPVERLFIRLAHELSKESRVKVYNFGLAILDGIFYSASAGSHYNETTIFRKTRGDLMMRMEKATGFFRKLGLGEVECDLLILNCVGCEYDVLESLIASNMHRYFKHIQFQTYLNLEYIDNPLYRHCRIQQFLRRKFIPRFLHPPVCEAWDRKQ